ncbi:MAG: hypothetical protein ACP5H5_08000 [Pyrobaculum sp.]
MLTADPYEGVCMFQLSFDFWVYVWLNTSACPLYVLFQLSFDFWCLKDGTTGGLRVSTIF